MSALFKSTLSVGSMTLLSRVLGLLRDIVIARFGRSYGSLDYLGWPALFDQLVAAIDGRA